MSYRPASVELAPVRMKPCGFRGCTSLGSFVITAGGAKQVYVCAECAKVGIEADRRSPGKGWNG